MREQYIINVPKKWLENKKAGLCPVCGKHPADFEKRRKVYCSEKCSTDFSTCFISWDGLREKILHRGNHKCAECDYDEDSFREKEKQRILNLNEEIQTKYEKEISYWKLEQLRKKEEWFLNEIKNIENAKIDDWDLKHFLESKLDKKLSFDEKYFSGFDVDHIEAVALGGDMWDEKNLQVLCKSCHVKKTRIDMKKLKAKRLGVEPLSVSNGRC